MTRELEAELLAALKWTTTQLEEWDEYQKRPERRAWGVECACCMGEMFDREDRDKLAEARAAISQAEGRKT